MHFLRSIIVVALLAVAGIAQESSSQAAQQPASAAPPAAVPATPAATLETLTAKATAGDAGAAFVLGPMYVAAIAVSTVPNTHPRFGRVLREAGWILLLGVATYLALILAKGRGVEADPVEAAKWYEKAAQHGDQQAAINLGILYAQGKGVKQDTTQAAHWFRLAADAGNAMAEYNLGLLYSEQLYSEGKTEAEDDKQAAFWLGKAAEHGVIAAQNNLGVLYADGRGVAKDLVQAYKWFSLAGEAGDPNATDAVQALTAEMKPEEIAQAKKLAAEWVSRHSQEIK